MLIEYLTTKSRRNVSDSVGTALIARKIARGVYDTRELTPERIPTKADAVEPQEPKTTRRRNYRRRDMQASE